MPSLFLGNLWFSLALAGIAAVVSFALEAMQLHGALASLAVGVAVGVSNLLFNGHETPSKAEHPQAGTVTPPQEQATSSHAFANTPVTAEGKKFSIPKDLHQQQELYRQVTTDSLTGLANRLHFQARLEEVVAQSNRDPGRQVSLALFSFDSIPFSSLAQQDTYITRIAATCRPIVRPGDVVSRLEGSLFALLLPNAGPRAAMACADRLRHALSGVPIPGEPPESSPMPRSLHYFGVATLKAGECAEDLQERATQTMVLARTSPHERVLFASNAPPLL